MIQRCPWANVSALEQEYHDQQWGKPTKDDSVLFEFLVLESMQAGLSWKTILVKREAFRLHLDDYDYHKIAEYDEAKLNQLLQEPSIIRHKLKLQATINNAQRFIEVQKEYGSFANYLWKFTNYQVIDNKPSKMEEIPAYNELAEIITKELKRRNFKFLGPTIIYSYLQAIGIINDHLEFCFVRNIN